VIVAWPSRAWITYLARKLAQEGSIVTGIDSSAELIKAAPTHELASRLPTSFDVGTVDALPYEAGSFDRVLCNHLMNDLHDPAQALKEFARVLRDCGRVVILMLHPCFYNNHAERAEPENNLPTSSYFQTRRIVQNFDVDGLQSPVANTSWLRPLESYTQALRESGFVITSLTEPHPTQQMIQEDEWWRTSFSRPLFMLLIAELR
jgi:2-polyprenyl-3-methyl-5-hydroxy-6-metoxy-1,4-benzoquinol methylase